MTTYCIAGKNEIAIRGVELLIEKGILKSDILCCPNLNDDNIDSWQPSFRRFASEHSYTIVKLDNLYEIANLVFISLEFDRIVKPELFATKSLYNIHFSLLPAYKGMFTSIMPIINGENKSGVTLHYIDSGIDTGRIINQIEFPIGIMERGFDLYQSYLKHSKDLLERNLNNIIGKLITSKVQKCLGASYYSNKSVDFSNIKVDYRKTAFEIHNWIRAFTFRPYQLVEIQNSFISHTELTEVRSTKKPGHVTKIDNLSYILSTIDYDLIIYLDLLEEILEASKNDNVDLIRRAAELKYTLEDKNSKGWNSIIVATYNESRNVFDFLQQRDADINTCNYNGTTLFMYAMTKACSSNNTYFLKELLDRGVNTSKKDRFGLDVFDYCIKLNNKKILNFIGK